MLKELLKPRSYESALEVKNGNYLRGGVGVLTATTLRSMISFGGMKVAKIDNETALKASISANIAISASIFIYYMLAD